MEHDKRDAKLMAMEHDQEGEKQRQPRAMTAVLLMMEAGRSRARGLRATRRRQGYRGFSRVVKRLVVKRRRFAGRASREWWRNGRSDQRRLLHVAADGGGMVTGRTGSEEDGGWLGGYWWFGRLCAWLPAEVRW
ncbi:glycoside hydrolase family 5 protein [Sesbania bispinosa]|nr:glycoside hydrolase family 5 protein [Sesbania bispinosa]